MGNLSAPEALSLRWAEIENQRSLRDLPYKIELNLWGKIEMSPASFWHGRLQGAISVQIANQLPQGEALTEIPILTDIGVRVPDVAWASRDWLRRNRDASPASSAPEICVEVVSPSNTEDEIQEKTRAYLAAGAQEVWICHENGQIRHFNAQGQQTASRFGVNLRLPIRGAQE